MRSKIKSCTDCFLHISYFYLIQHSEFPQAQIQSGEIINRRHFLVEVEFVMLTLKELLALKKSTLELCKIMKRNQNSLSLRKNVLFSGQRQACLIIV